MTASSSPTSWTCIRTRARACCGAPAASRPPRRRRRRVAPPPCCRGTTARTRLSTTGTSCTGWWCTRARPRLGTTTRSSASAAARTRAAASGTSSTTGWCDPSTRGASRRSASAGTRSGSRCLARARCARCGCRAPTTRTCSSTTACTHGRGPSSCQPRQRRHRWQRRSRWWRQLWWVMARRPRWVLMVRRPRGVVVAVLAATAAKARRSRARWVAMMRARWVMVMRARWEVMTRRKRARGPQALVVAVMRWARRARMGVHLAPSCAPWHRWSSWRRCLEQMRTTRSAARLGAAVWGAVESEAGAMRAAMGRPRRPAAARPAPDAWRRGV
mmetsp:Transcript_20961/g.67488  ORF Transcript_20961/g.67488 Transcript_20961/m.67488 type:complete len:330 (+) Transcript_20961:2591-3580(+)